MTNLPDNEPTRKQRFDAAVKLSGLTVLEWCEAHDVSRQHLGLVLSGERDASAELNAAIDATINKYLPASAA